MKTIQFIFEVLINLAEVGLFFYFITHMLILKNPKIHNKIVICGIIGNTLIATMLNLSEIHPVFRISYFLLFQIIFTLIFMQGTNTERIVWGVFYTLFDSLSDSMAFVLLEIFTTKNANELYSEYPQRFVTCVIYVMILTILVLIVTRNNHRKYFLPNWMLVSFLILTALIAVSIQFQIEFIINMSLVLSKNNQTSIYIFILITLCVFASAIVLFLRLGIIYQKNLDLIEETQENKIEGNKMELMSNTIQTLRSWKHDSSNNLFALEGLIERGENAKALEYIHELYQSYNISGWGHYTGNDIIDTVVSIKLMSIQEKGIKFFNSFDQIKDIPISNVLLSSLIGNLFDNAIEACERMKNTADTYISVSMKQVKGNIYLKIDNSSSGSYIYSQPSVLTTNKNSLDHGFGVKRIKKIVKDAGGIYKFDPHEDKFIVSIEIPI